MNSRLLLAFLCLASFSTGCIVVDEDDRAYPGDVSFLWTFEGLRCDQSREVFGVNVEIPGESLHNGGRYACNTGGVDGITLHDFRAGSYTYILTAVDVQNRVVYEARGTFRIDGNVTVRADLMGEGDPASYALLNWTFPGNASCGQAGVASVDITLDDQAPANFPCFEGQRSPGLQTPDLAPGEHFIEFIARDASGNPLYYYNGGLVTQAYNPVSASYNLYAVGGAAISWRFSDGSVTRDCPSSTLEVGVNFQDTATGEWVYGALGDWQLCQDKPITYSFLRPGTYKVSLYAKNGNTEYRSNSNMAPILVRAHQFPGPNDALEVTMFRQ
ncbi:hypothetical protein POL68_14870 [Stigmatella sp. ncwal1]|uniref:Ig-like domain-containing protein n=1 Tax=Stigmatella ashevillensis TaxID=2995309 RepID=A0ABT5D7V8_9BACT|nr:hypothetical protein [Stigmatella ashevillena]MDC0709752.1 hypothetical protein [Stigmatella ashevillena]